MKNTIIRKIAAMLRFCILLSAICLGSSASAQNANLTLNPEAQERAAIVRAAREAFERRDFAELERQSATYRLGGQRTGSGAFKIMLFDDGVREGMKGSAPSEATFKKQISIAANWVQQFPTSVLARTLHARAWMLYAGYFRGTGFSNTVSPTQWEKWFELNTEAAKILEEARSMAANDTTWHRSMIVVGTNLGWPREVVMSIARSAAKVDPNDFRIYVNTLGYLSPKYYGDAEQIDNYILEATAITREKHGAEMYARLYSGLREEVFGDTLYQSSKVNWGKMKIGLTDWTARFPTSWNHNIFADHACLAGDKVATRQQLEKIGKDVLPQLWGSGNSGVEYFNACKKWAEGV